MPPTSRFPSPVLPAILLGFALVACLVQPALAVQQGRVPSPFNDDPCGLPDTGSEAYRIAAALNWGYGVDTLRADLARWASSPFAHLDSIGASVQNRALYLLTIQDTAAPASPRKRVWIHARTHPNEVQGTWVANEIITQLLGPSPIAAQLRSGCVFNIVPMINPDGVELQYPRQNANGIDIESNWTVVPGEPEVQTLRRTFVNLMAQPNPITIALNLHSAYGTNRYFVYHAPGGTTPSYALDEQRFINRVRSYFPGGIRQYDFYVSWISAPSYVYPEGWFWQNCGGNVLALTYEDMNDPAARAFDSTAAAILRGIGDELGVTNPTDVPGIRVGPLLFALEQNYPNPFNPTTQIRYHVPTPSGEGREGSGASEVRLVVYDLLGREVAVLVNERQSPGSYQVRFDAGGLASGMYLYRLTADDVVQTRRMAVIK